MGSSPGSAPDSSSWAPWEAVDDDSSTWSPCHHVGNADTVLGFRFGSGPALAAMDIWRVTWQMEDLCSSALQINKMYYYCCLLSELFLMPVRDLLKRLGHSPFVFSPVLSSEDHCSIFDPVDL